MDPSAPKILLIGSYPPPVGGNSVHIQRLCARLQDRGWDVRVLDYLGGSRPAAASWVTRLPASWPGRLAVLWRISRKVSDETIVHFHVSALGRFRWFAPFLFWLFRRQAKVLTVHSGSFVAQARRLPKFYLRWLCRHFRSIVAVNGEQKSYLEELGVPPTRLWLIPAYLPAVAQAELVPHDVASRRSGRIVLITSGDLTPTYQYGPLIECLERLDPDRYLGLFAFYGRSEETYARSILDRLAGRPNAIVLRDQPANVFVSLLAAADVYVRLTTTDGDSVAMREALALGKAVMASDVVSRPSSCKTFPLDRPDHLHRLIADFQPVRDAEMVIDDSNFHQLLRVYEASRGGAERHGRRLDGRQERPASSLTIGGAGEFCVDVSRLEAKPKHAFREYESRTEGV
jgi:glycosyltransferase involved in cell wall biosynthesis